MVKQLKLVSVVVCRTPRMSKKLLLTNCLLHWLQGAVYGSLKSVLDADLFREVVDYKVAEHAQRQQLRQEGYSS